MDDFFDFAFDVFLMQNMPFIHNSKLPKEIKDSWIDLAITCNVSKLHEPVIVFN